VPAIGRDFGADLTTLQWVVTAYTLMLAGLGVNNTIARASSLIAVAVLRPLRGWAGLHS